MPLERSAQATLVRHEKAKQAQESASEPVLWRKRTGSEQMRREDAAQLAFLGRLKDLWSAAEAQCGSLVESADERAALRAWADATAVTRRHMYAR